MRVCLYTGTALPKLGGQEFVVDALARHLSILGRRVVVLAPRPRPPLRADDAGRRYAVVRHPRFYSTRHFVPWYRWWLLQLHRTHGFEVLHCHGVYPPGYLAALCRGRLGVPIVITSHGGDVWEGSARLLRPVLHRRHVQALEGADALVAISRFTREGLTRMCPGARRIVDIPNGIEVEPFAAAVRRPDEFGAGIRPGEYALFLGRLHRRKGADVLLRAMALIAPAGRVDLVIAGDGEERRTLETEAARLGLGGRVRFVGWVAGPSKTYLLQNALCVVVPSRGWEAFGLVVLEGYAAGRPVIASDLPGLRDLVQPGRTGFLVAPESPEDLAQALRLVLGDPPRSRSLGEAGRRFAEEHRWEAIARRHSQLYEELVAAAAARATL
jgi:glycosyltransferase involved in cell wall biosynthesis